jgi:hypothetical protein
MPPNRRSVRVTRYLPDVLRERARAGNRNLSRILRDAVERELRGDGPSPAVEVECVGSWVALRVSAPVDMLREQTR